MMTLSRTFRFTDFGRKYHVYTYNLIISQQILMRFYKIDHTLIELNPRRHDDVITTFSVHWFRAEIACLHLSLDHFSSDFDDSWIDHSLIEINPWHHDDWWHHYSLFGSLILNGNGMFTLITWSFLIRSIETVGFIWSWIVI